VNKEQLIIEYTKCMRNTPYALRTYLQTYDNTVSKYVPLELFPDQVSLLEDYETYNENIALKYRQAGVSTVTAAWASKKLAFARKEKPEKVLIIANKLDTSVEMANKIRAFIEQWPSWVSIGFSVEKNSQRHFKLNNGCEVKAVATSKDALEVIHQQFLFLTKRPLSRQMETFGQLVWPHYLLVVKLLWFLHQTVTIQYITKSMTKR
jgi:hypothetical protein